jgi:D-psicose/D-tagatose/L-ribulose 3-epimerase
LREISPIAEDQGVTLCLEVLNRFEGHLINTVEQGLDLLAEIDSPSVFLHLDTFHLNIEEADIPAAIRSTGERLGHFHASENNRRRPGKGHIPWQDVKHALDQIDYQGWIVMESFVQPKGEVGQTLNIWRNLANDLNEEASQGASFLRKTFLTSNV